jgi:hypothetical protein
VGVRGGLMNQFPTHGLPEGIEIHTVDDIFVKQMVLPAAGLLVQQHSHAYAHLSMLATGRVRVWKEGELLGDFKAPTGIEIAAHAKHKFVSLEPSIIYCIHNIGRAGIVEVES